MVEGHGSSAEEKHVRWARSVMANAIDPYWQRKHPDIQLEWVERALMEQERHEVDPIDGRDLYYGYLPETGHWLKVVVEDNRLVTAYQDRRLDQRFGRRT